MTRSPILRARFAKKPDGVGPFGSGVQVSAQNGDVPRGGVLMLQRPDGLTIVAADQILQSLDNSWNMTPSTMAAAPPAIAT